MQVHSFIAESAPDAGAQIRAHLGPEAVVLNVRRLAGEGLARLWQRPRIEVLAYKPDAPAAHGPRAARLHARGSCGPTRLARAGAGKGTRAPRLLSRLVVTALPQ